MAVDRQWQGLALGAVVSISGCVIAVDDGYCFGEFIGKVVIDTDNGNVDVRAGGERCIDVSLGGVGSGAAGQRTEGDVLYLDYDCDGLCGGDISVVMPARADLDVRLGAGDVTVQNRSGDVAVHLGVGSVLASQLTGGVAELIVGTGDIDAVWHDRPSQVDLVVASGTIALGLPSGEYALDLSGDTVSVAPEIVHTEQSPARVKAETGVGSIEVRSSGVGTAQTTTPTDTGDTGAPSGTSGPT